MFPSSPSSIEPLRGMSRETKNSLGWLGAAVILFGAVVWWKSDRIFGADTPDPSTPRPFQPIRGTDRGAPRIAVTVVDDKTGSPLLDARVVILDRKGKILADEKTPTSGKVDLRPTKGELRGVAAWHEDHAVVGVVTATGPVEIRLQPVKYVDLDIGELNPARIAWFKIANAGITFKYKRSFVNPVAAGPDFLASKLCEHLGFYEKRWPVDHTPVRVPRYLPHDAEARMITSPSLPNHLDVRGMRDPAPPVDLHNTREESQPSLVRRDVASFRIPSPPASANALVGRYRRQPGDMGILMLHLRQLDRDPGSPNYGSPITAKSKSSTYDESDGAATFRVFELEKTTVFPTILLFPSGAPRKLIRCNPVELDGLTEVELTPLKPCKLTVNVEGGDGTVTLLDDRHEPMILTGEQRREGDARHFSELEPMTYRIVAQTKTHSSPTHVVRLAPGEDKKIELKLRPACRVTLVLMRANQPQAFLLRNKTTGDEHEFLNTQFPRNFNIQVTGVGADQMLRMTGLRHELFLPHGDYEFVRGERGGARGKPIAVTIKGTTQDVSLN